MEEAIPGGSSAKKYIGNTNQLVKYGWGG